VQRLVFRVSLLSYGSWGGGLKSVHSEQACWKFAAKCRGQWVRKLERSAGERSQTCVQEKGQLLENVFADPKGFGIAADGKYRYEQPGFGSGTAAVS